MKEPSLLPDIAKEKTLSESITTRLDATLADFAAGFVKSEVAEVAA